MNVILMIKKTRKAHQISLVRRGTNSPYPRCKVIQYFSNNIKISIIYSKNWYANTLT